MRRTGGRQTIVNTSRREAPEDCPARGLLCPMTLNTKALQSFRPSRNQTRMAATTARTNRVHWRVQVGSPAEFPAAAAKLAQRKEIVRLSGKLNPSGLRHQGRAPASRETAVPHRQASRLVRISLVLKRVLQDRPEWKAQAAPPTMPITIISGNNQQTNSVHRATAPAKGRSHKSHPSETGLRHRYSSC